MNIGIIHICGMLVEDMYGFIMRKHIFLDQLYMMSFVTIPLSWIIFKDECIISYLAKKIKNHHYTLGNEPENVNDISDLFTNKQQYFIYQWEPFEIGQIIVDDETNQHKLHIVEVYDETIFVPFFHSQLVHKKNIYILYLKIYFIEVKMIINMKINKQHISYT